MARKRNTNFRLGIERKQLIEAAILYGKTEKTAKKTNTVNLEKFLTRQILGKGVKVPELNDNYKRDIKQNAEAWGVKEAIKRFSYIGEKLTGRKDENNFLRLTIQDGFSLYYDGAITSSMVDELENRISSTSIEISALIKITPYYRNLYIDYAEELEEQEQEKQQKSKKG